MSRRLTQWQLKNFIFDNIVSVMDDNDWTGAHVEPDFEGYFQTTCSILVTDAFHRSFRIRIEPV